MSEKHFLEPGSLKSCDVARQVCSLLWQCEDTPHLSCLITALLSYSQGLGFFPSADLAVNEHVRGVIFVVCGEIALAHALHQYRIVRMEMAAC